MRLIDADVLWQAMMSVRVFHANTSREESLLRRCEQLVDNAPTVEARPVVHGEWIKYRLSKLFKYTCSVCHCDVEEKTPFCPWCTADMRGGKNE